MASDVGDVTMPKIVYVVLEKRAGHLAASIGVAVQINNFLLTEQNFSSTTD
jgi:hypothetical protein